MNEKEATTKDGRRYEIRHPTMDDVESALSYINRLSKERTYITFQGEQLTLDEEKQFIAKCIERNEKKKGVALFLMVGNEVNGMCSIEMKIRTESHIGSAGISIDKDLRGQGLGESLFKQALDEARENIPELRIVELSVYENNSTGLNMYDKLGFVEYGRLKDGAKLGNVFVDVILMAKRLKD